MFEKKEFINVTYAGFWVRFVAGFIDAIILTFLIQALIILSFILLATFGIISLINNFDILSILSLFANSFFTMVVLMVCLPIITVLFYNIGFLSSDIQATPGMRVCGIYIQDEYGEGVKSSRVFVRFFLKNIYFIPIIAFMLLVSIDSNSLFAINELIAVDPMLYGVCKISFYILVSITFIGNLLIFISKENRSFHDMLCSTKIVCGLKEVDKLINR